MIGKEQIRLLLLPRKAWFSPRKSDFPRNLIAKRDWPGRVARGEEKFAQRDDDDALFHHFYYNLFSLLAVPLVKRNGVVKRPREYGMRATVAALLIASKKLLSPSRWMYNVLQRYKRLLHFISPRLLPLCILFARIPH